MFGHQPLGVEESSPTGVWQGVHWVAVELGTHGDTGQGAAGHGHVAVKMALGNSCCCWTECGKIQPGGD